LAIRVNGEIESPTGMSSDKQGEEIKLLYERSGVEAMIKAEQKGTHVTFELISIAPREKVELIIWGPYPTTIKEIVGETVGVVRNSEFAIGIQALNLKTLGGYPTHENDVDPAYDIFATSSLVDVDDTVKIIYRGQTAKPTAFGSVLQAYCRDRSEDRIIPNWGHDRYYVPAFHDGGVIGSKIALFGCPEPMVLEILSQIELAEGLPHPEIDGVWGKISPTATASYLVMSFGEHNLDEAIELTKKAGLKYLYHGGPFETWGHFKLNENGFPDNWESMRRCVERAKKQGVRLGVHTLSNFITTNDPYVTPVPDDRLAKVGYSRLSADIDERTTEIPIEEPIFFNQMKNNTLHAAVVGKEIIRYERVSERRPWRLLGCERGAFGTRATRHAKGDVIGKLMDHPYRVFLTDNELAEEVAVRIAELFNQTGLMQISFDGLEGNWSTGMGQYARQRFVKIWYDHLKPELRGKVINDASNPGHYFWHIFTRMNWGEPWYAGFRESQLQYRLLNQDYFRRNLIPPMLGWFRMTPETSLEDIEWLLARSAGFDAGFALVTEPSIVERNGFGDEILKAIKEWEKARLSGAFSEEQKRRLRDIRAEFRLEPIGENVWNLYQFAVERHRCDRPGKLEGNSADWSFKFHNPYDSQPTRFVLRSSGDLSLSDISFQIDDRERVNISVTLPGQSYLKYEGEHEAWVYDRNWNPIEKVQMDPSKLTVSTGEHTISFTCTCGEAEEEVAMIELKCISGPEIVRSSV
jgi:hypothetical protein